MNNKATHQHLTYFDFWRGIAIVMVVSIHVGISNDSNFFLSSLNLLFRFLCNGAVPIFLAISGFFLAKKSIVDRSELLSFYSKRISNVYIPMLFWSVPLYCLAVLNGAHPLKGTLKLFMGWYSVYYFIILIIQCYVFLPLIKRNLKVSLLLSWLLTLLSWISINYVFPPLPLVVYAGPITTWGIFFVLGVCLSQKKRNYSILIPSLIILLGVGLQFLEVRYLNAPVGQKISAVISNIGIVLLMFSSNLQIKYVSQNWICKTFDYLGRKSFGIYLIHCYFIDLLSHFVGLRLWSLRCLIVILCSVILAHFTKRFLPSQFCSKYLGFK